MAENTKPDQVPGRKRLLATHDDHTTTNGFVSSLSQLEAAENLEPSTIEFLKQVEALDCIPAEAKPRLQTLIAKHQKH